MPRVALRHSTEILYGQAGLTGSRDVGALWQPVGDVGDGRPDSSNHLVNTFCRTSGFVRERAYDMVGLRRIYLIQCTSAVGCGTFRKRSGTWQGGIGFTWMPNLFDSVSARRKIR